MKKCTNSIKKVLLELISCWLVTCVISKEATCFRVRCDKEESFVCIRAKRTLLLLYVVNPLNVKALAQALKKRYGSSLVVLRFI